MTSPHAELEALQGQLAARASVRHFAHAAISTLVGLIAAGTLGKLLWDDTEQTRPFVPVAAAVMVVMLGYALARYLLGRTSLKIELAQFERLNGLRRTLQLDDTAQLLPR